MSDKPGDVIRQHAQSMMLIPSGEQWIGHIQTVISAALNDLAKWMDEQDRKPRKRKAVQP